jgi:hypothetical protein
MRVADGAMRQTRNGGYLHLISVEHRALKRARFAEMPIKQRSDFTALAKYFAASVSASHLDTFAHGLGLTPVTLRQLGIGWASADDIRQTGTKYSSKIGCWAFPMFNLDTPKVTGIRLRTSDGNKFAITGSRDGLFLGPIDGGELILIAEGPTDTAALIDLGFINVIGRPSCTGGIGQSVDAAKLWGPSEIVLVADADDPGQRGAMNLSSVLRAYVPTVRVVTPPNGIKDIRAWKQAGATHKDIMDAIKSAKKQKLAFTLMKRGKHHG